MRRISNLERMKAQSLRRVKDSEMRAMLDFTGCQLSDQVMLRYLRQYIFEDILKHLKLTFI
jgi:hypothetical protein